MHLCALNKETYFIQEKEIAGLTLLEYGQRNSRPSKANKNAQDEPDQQVKELVTGYSLSDKCTIKKSNLAGATLILTKTQKLMLKKIPKNFAPGQPPPPKLHIRIAL